MRLREAMRILYLWRRWPRDDYREGGEKTALETVRYDRALRPVDCRDDDTKGRRKSPAIYLKPQEVVIGIKMRGQPLL